LLIQSNHDIGSRMLKVLHEAKTQEVDKIPQSIMDEIIFNDVIARDEQIPMCQDTGMAVIFLEIGHRVQIIGSFIEKALNEAVSEAYTEAFLRKSVVGDPLFTRKNTTNNTPAIIHYQFVEGDQIFVHVAPKGFGSENMSQIKMLKPADGVKGVKTFVVDCVKEAGPNPCPPIVIGIGIGGTFEKAALLSKKALIRDLGLPAKDSNYRILEQELLKEINTLDIGPGGFGGKTTCLGVHIEHYPTHIAGLPVAVNICCHAYRHASAVI